MVRKILYLTLIGFSTVWGAFNFFDIELGFGVDLARFMPDVVRPDAIPPGAWPVFAWTCLGLTAVFYLIGLVKIYWSPRRDPWAAILFTVALIITGIGLGFYRLQIMGLIDRSSLYLIAVMVIPFAPAIIYLPFATTYKNYFAARPRP